MATSGQREEAYYIVHKLHKQSMKGKGWLTQALLYKPVSANALQLAFSNSVTALLCMWRLLRNAAIRV